MTQLLFLLPGPCVPPPTSHCPGPKTASGLTAITLGASGGGGAGRSLVGDVGDLAVDGLPSCVALGQPLLLASLEKLVEHLLYLPRRNRYEPPVSPEDEVGRPYHYSRCQYIAFSSGVGSFC